MVNNNLQCSTASFPTTYLGLPISDKKLRRGDLFVWMEKIASKLPGWKASLLTSAGRAVLTRFVLTAIPVYILVAIKVPKWFLRSVDKIRKGFLSIGRKSTNGGCCLVAWENVMRPIDLGGLGIHNFVVLGWALQLRWLWLDKTKPDRHWAGLKILVYNNTAVMLAISIETTVGNGRDTPFWSDRWLHGCRLEELAPEVVRCVPLRIRKRRKVNEALHDHAWVADIRSALGWRGLAEYLYLWDLLYIVGSPKLQVYSLRNRRTEISLLEPLLLGHGRKLGNEKCKTFCVAGHSESLLDCGSFTKKRDASSGALPPLRLREETTQHILTSCVFARQFLYAVLQPLSLINLTPTRRDTFATGG
jgi:hypothetical protein